MQTAKDLSKIDGLPSTRADRCSRRRFLASALLTGAGAVLWPISTASTVEAAGIFAAPSIRDQKKIGIQASKRIFSRYVEVHDPRVGHFQEIGRRVVDALPAIDRRTWDFRFHVAEGSDRYVLALPGSPVVLFTDLYAQLPTDDALAAVAAHAMAHIRFQQWAKAYAREQERHFGSGLLMILRGGRPVQTISSLAENAIDYRYTPAQEMEADDGALTNVADAGFNPQGMMQLFDTLRRLAGGGASEDQPVTQSRIDNIQRRIDQLSTHAPFPPLTPLDYNALKS